MDACGRHRKSAKRGCDIPRLTRPEHRTIVSFAQEEIMLAKHPEPTVAHVLKTWAPRMIVQGIDYNDLMTPVAAFQDIRAAYRRGVSHERATK